DFEGIANSLLEAMAVGLPCVSTDHTPGGARLLIQDRENGLLAPIGDAEKLAAA
ncbi:MAG: glycosyltransferase, partial [Thermoguttaceae bacterium]|nr:glycosyltransferase [Thermoguttaceae bacterium]